ncbi:MAG: aminodeoxychorismate synthase component I [Gammaproteobacteria bacterium]|nr:aminodeoxychorismate synthase component I [Gammaproteobacteria bacterium]
MRLPYWADNRQFYAQLRELPWPVWLDSGFPESGGGRYDIIAADPYLTLTSKDGVAVASPSVEIRGEARVDPLALLRRLLGERALPARDLPFSGGAIGFLGYDLARSLGDLPPREGLYDWPDMAVGLYDWAVVIDHARQRTYFVRQGRDPRDDNGWQSALRRLLAISTAPPPPVEVVGSLPETGMSPAAYARGFDRIKHYIREGDCYQVNLAQRFRAETQQDAWTLYQRMRQENPAPFGALLEYPFGQVLSSSPEQFLSLQNGRAQTRPIKGTRPRGGSAEQDLALRAQLLSSEKDRAENVMIVDLLRNDLGKVCEPGSIEVPGLFQVESFATVHHLVSTVTGHLRADKDALDLIAACFPGGSITGAPKRRAMEIIDELEPVRREVYCGNVIRLGFDGNLESSITIRTALMQGDSVYYWAGGGIVADSDCDDEYQESLDKAAAFLRLVS